MKFLIVALIVLFSTGCVKIGPKKAGNPFWDKQEKKDVDQSKK